MKLVGVLAFVLVVAGCDRVIEDPDPPDASGPSLTAIWDPATCRGDPRARIEVRLDDGAGTSIVGESACAPCTLEVAVPHVGWYRAAALAVDADGAGTALATTTLAIDAPAVRWRVAW